MTEESWVGFQTNGLLMVEACACCEYFYAEEFEHGRYANKVPCGDCFWGMGLLNCLR